MRSVMRGSDGDSSLKTWIVRRDVTTARNRASASKYSPKTIEACWPRRKTLCNCPLATSKTRMSLPFSEAVAIERPEAVIPRATTGVSWAVMTRSTEPLSRSNAATSP
eukprot:Amastigsp_a512341_10.p4 type:complete len:108 gc:universal Amastigsp_a512341_10:128-451(+)